MSNNTPDLQIGHIATNQASPEITANQAFDQLDTAMTQQLTIGLVDADYTLQDNPPISSEARYNMVFVITGALTADRNIIVPTTSLSPFVPASKLYIFSNQTTGGHNIIVKTAAGTGVAIDNAGSSSPFVVSDYVMLYCDGVNVVPLSGLNWS